jgi:hypothetical protein
MLCLHVIFLCKCFLLTIFQTFFFILVEVHPVALCIRISFKYSCTYITTCCEQREKVTSINSQLRAQAYLKGIRNL